MHMDVKAEVLEAAKRITGHIRETPVEFSHYLSELGDCKVYLKLESSQISGSFKLRGAMNKYLSLSNEDRSKYIVTASTGNHGAAVGYVLDKFGGKGAIYLPNNASKAKINALKEYNVDLKFHGDDSMESEIFARETAGKNGHVFISPYNDAKVIAGQGTIGVELMKQVELINSVLIPVGGGGLIAGVAGYLKSIDENIEIIGCQPENSCVMYESIRAGKIIEMESKPTISDGTAGGIETGSITFDLCRQYIDDFILPAENEIKEAIKLILEKHYLAVEGAAALQVASFIKEKNRFKGKTIVLILSGKKIGLDTLRKVLEED